MPSRGYLFETFTASFERFHEPGAAVQHSSESTLLNNENIA